MSESHQEGNDQSRESPGDETSNQQDDISRELSETRSMGTNDKPESDVEKGIDENEKDSAAKMIVTWDGADDPKNPKNWSFKRRWAITALVSLVTFMTPMSSAIIAPASNAIGNEFGVHSSFLKQLNFSIILLAYVIGPLVLAPLCEVYGRVIVLQLANGFFLIFNFVCGFAHSEGEFLAFRFLSGLGGCAPLTIGGGVLSDLWRPEERGMAIALYTLAPLLSPALGPLLGAWITEKSTWRWCFWSVTIFGVIVQFVVFFMLNETYGPRILQRKAQKLRKETGNDQLRTEFELKDLRLITIMRTSLVRVVLLLTTQPIIIFLAVYFAAVYGIIYLMLSSFPSLWTTYYHESLGIGGLNYIAIMIGLTIGAQTGGRLVDYGYRTLKARSPDNTGSPEFRVPLLFVSTLLVSAGLFMYGWSAQARTFWISADIGAAIFSIGAAMTFTSIQTYVIDAYPLFAASAIGATAVLRSLTGFGFPLFAPAMYTHLGYGWGNSVLGFAILVIGYGGALILWFFGKRLREGSPYARGGN